MFWEGEVRPDNVVRLALPTGRLIEEGLEHRDELLSFLAQLEDNRVRLEAVEGALAHLDGTAAAIVSALGRVASFPAVCQSVGIDPLSGARTVALLDQMGALRMVRNTAGAEPRARRGADAALRECVRTHVRLLAELTAPVVAMEGAEPVRQRLCEVAREAAERHPQLLAGLEFGPGGALDPEVVIERALCFPGDREREVRAALGELVSYTEFELLNHPQGQERRGVPRGARAAARGALIRRLYARALGERACSQRRSGESAVGEQRRSFRRPARGPRGGASEHLTGLNPIREALGARRRELRRLDVRAGATHPGVALLVARARQLGVRVREVAERRRRASRLPGRGARCRAAARARARGAARGEPGALRSAHARRARRRRGSRRTSARSRGWRSPRARSA